MRTAATRRHAARAEAERLRVRAWAPVLIAPGAPLSSAEMAGLRFARLMAPLALVGCAVALYVVIDAARWARTRRARPHRIAPASAHRRRRQRAGGAQGAPQEAIHREIRRHRLVHRREDRRSALRRSRSSTRTSTRARSARARGSSSDRERPRQRGGGRRPGAARAPRCASSPPSPRLRSPRRSPPAPALHGRPAVSAPSAIVTDAESGRILWSRSARRNALDRLDHEAHDRPADARARAALRRRAGRPLRRAAGRVPDQPRPRGAHDGRRPAARAAAGVGQRRRGHARRGRLGLPARLRAGDEPPRPPARPRPTPATRTRSASTRRATTPPRAIWPGSPLELRRNAFFRSTVNRPSATLQSGARDADDRQPQRPGRARAVDRRGQDRTHAAGGLRARRRRAADGPARRQGDLGGARHGSRGRARRRHADAPALGTAPVPARARGARAATSMASVPIRYRRGAEVDLVAGRTLRLTVLRGQRRQHAAGRRAARGDRSAAPRPARRRHRGAGRRQARADACRWSPPPRSRRPASPSRPRTGSPGRWLLGPGRRGAPR